MIFFSFQVKMAQNPWAVDSIKSFYFLKCPECDFSYRNSVDLDIHILKHKPEQDLLFCDHCEFSSKLENEYDNHIEMEHLEGNEVNDIGNEEIKKEPKQPNKHLPPNPDTTLPENINHTSASYKKDHDHKKKNFKAEIYDTSVALMFNFQCNECDCNAI